MYGNSSIKLGIAVGVGRVVSDTIASAVGETEVRRSSAADILLEFRIECPRCLFWELGCAVVGANVGRGNGSFPCACNAGDESSDFSPRHSTVGIKRIANANAMRKHMRWCLFVQIVRLKTLNIMSAWSAE